MSEDGFEQATEPASSGDEAALAAAASFWNDNPDLERAAAKEEPDSEPGMSPTRANALRTEYADQQNSLEQEGELDPESPDGIPGKKQNSTAKVKQAPVGQPAAAAADDTAEAGLDPTLRAIAEDSGWTAEDIDELYETNPDVATRTFERLADNYANLSRQYLTSPAPVAAPVQAQPAQVQQQAQPASQLPVELSDEALKKFAEDNGEASANLVKSLRNHFIARDQLHEQRYQKFEQEAKSAEMRTIAAEASGTMEDLQKRFPKLYGTSNDPKALTVAEQQKQIELGSLADQIRAGSIGQGRTLSVKQAMLRAHYIVSRDSVKAEARQEIAGAVRKRARAATARPTQRTNPALAPAAKSDEAAINAAAEKMAEIGWNDGE